mgnify:CR=1 FL=1
MKKTDYLLPFIMKISLFSLNYSIFDYWSLQKNRCWFSDDITPDTVTGINPKTNNRQPTTTSYCFQVSGLLRHSARTARSSF